MRFLTTVSGIGLTLALPSVLFAQSILTIAGGGTEDGRPATAVGVYAVGVAVDAAGNLYLADSANNRIQKVAAGSGIITTVAGNGSLGYSGDGSSATAASLNSPGGVAVDSEGSLYIADTFNSRIRKVAAGSGIITTIAGNGTDVLGDGNAATQAGLYLPNSLAFDSAGNLYVADTYHNRIRKVAAATGIMTTVAGNGSDGFSSDGGAATAAGLSRPFGLAVDPAGNLFIADTHDNRIRKVAAGSGTITTVAGNGSPGFSGDGGAATAASLFTPYGPALDSAGNLYIPDAENNRIRRVDAGSGIITTVAGSGSPGFSGDGGSATEALLYLPIAVALDSTGSLYFADVFNYRVRKVTDGILSTVAGNGSYRPILDGGAAPSAVLSNPTRVAFDSDRNLYIADYGNRRVRKIAADSGIISTVAGDGSLGFSGDGGAATLAGLSPLGVAVDSAGNLYIADTESHRIRRVAAGTGIITTVAGNGSDQFSGDGGQATAAGLYAGDVALDAAGNLYITDTMNHRIRKVSAESGIITTIAGNGSDGYNGDGIAATTAQLNVPRGVALDSAGNLYVSDSYNFRIRKVAAATGIITTFAGNSNPSFTGDGVVATASGLSSQGLALDLAGNLFLADFYNDRIRRVAAGSGIITTVAGKGSDGFSGDGGAATTAELSSPHGVALDPEGNLYIADIFNKRVRSVPACVSVPRPELTVPSDGARGVSSAAKLAWKSVNGAFTYDIYLDKANPPQTTVASSISATSYPASNLELGATYFWTVVAKGDPFCPSPSTAVSEVRSFTTADGCGPATFN